MAINGANLQAGPEVMLMDAHHHLWKYSPLEYEWMDDSMSALKRDYLPELLELEMKQTPVNGSVVVQARQSLEETRWLLKQAEQHTFIKAVVGWVDLCSPELDRSLEEFAADPRFSGVRHVIHDEVDDDYMLGSDFMRGIARLEAFHLSYDLLLYPRHLKRAFVLAKQFPGQCFVLDHLGKPSIGTATMEPWRSDILRLASLPNVWCKLSGMVTEAGRDSWSYDCLLPYMEVVLNAFGTGRIMVGSDWPVCTLAAEYWEVMQIVPKFIASLDETDQTKILFQNAIDCYKINLESNGEAKV